MVSETLSKQQEEILDLLTKEFLTAKKISIRRGTSLTAVYKTMNKLKKKGYLSGTIMKGVKKRKRTKYQTPPHWVRLHGMEFNVRILYDSEKYHRARKAGNWLLFDGHKVKLCKSSFEVYQAGDHDFVGEDESRVTGLASEYWFRFFVRLESRLGIVFLKDGVSNVSVVKHHYAEVGNELAKDSRLRKSKLRVYTSDGGRLWLVADFSWRADELETQDRDSAKVDMGHVRRFFNDIRDNVPPVNSELASHIDRVVGLQEFHAKNIESHVKAIKSLASNIKSIEENINRFVDAVAGFEAKKARPVESVVDVLFEDDVLREKFHNMSTEEQNKFLGLKQ
jgi:hypothetical protein